MKLGLDIRILHKVDPSVGTKKSLFLDYEILFEVGGSSSTTAKIADS